MAIKKTARPTANKPATPIKTQAVRVRATRLGEYELKRRRIGDVFVMKVRVNAEGDAVLPSWVEEADTAAPLQQTTSQQALTAAVADVVRGGGTAAPAATASSGDDLGI
jgi:hypothetical protein